jgi:hypothetical protein
MTVSPKQRPKVAGLRNDTGPAHAPPTTSQAARCATPAGMRAASARPANRCAGPARCHLPAGETRILPGSEAETTGACTAVTSTPPARRAADTAGSSNTGHQPNGIRAGGAGKRRPRAA